MTLRDIISERTVSGARWSARRLFARALAVLALALPAQQALAQACPSSGDVDISVRESDSYCELCGVGQVTVRVNYLGNNNEPSLTNLVIAEDLSAPGLVPVPGTTTVSVAQRSDACSAHAHIGRRSMDLEFRRLRTRAERAESSEWSVSWKSPFSCVARTVQLKKGCGTRARRSRRSLSYGTATNVCAT